jgi:hypothetical protein
MVFRIRDSKTDIDGEKAVWQMVKTDLAPHFSDIRELISRLQKLKADDFVFPHSADQYRRRMRTLLIQIADEQPDLDPRHADRRRRLRSALLVQDGSHTDCGCWDI